MDAAGARQFVILGRSTCDKPSARNLVFRFEEAGATVKVIRGDITSCSDVETAVSTCVGTGSSLGGVLRAAMRILEALFAHIESGDWQTAIRPKW